MSRTSIKVYNKSGFTLIELLVAMAIAAILAAVAYPSYTSYITKARRKDAQAALMGLGGALERYKTKNGTYAVSAITDIYSNHTPLDVATCGECYYDLSIVVKTASSWTVAAVPISTSPQSGDGLLCLHSNGSRCMYKAYTPVVGTPVSVANCNTGGSCDGSW